MLGGCGCGVVGTLLGGRNLKGGELVGMVISDGKRGGEGVDCACVITCVLDWALL